MINHWSVWQITKTSKVSHTKVSENSKMDHIVCATLSDLLQKTPDFLKQCTLYIVQPGSLFMKNRDYRSDSYIIHIFIWTWYFLLPVQVWPKGGGRGEQDPPVCHQDHCYSCPGSLQPGIWPANELLHYFLFKKYIFKTVIHYTSQKTLQNYFKLFLSKKVTDLK